MISMVIAWYGRNQDDFSPNYSDEHHGTITGETPEECMRKLIELRYNHDIAKYTPIEIIYIY